MPFIALALMLGVVLAVVLDQDQWAFWLFIAGLVAQAVNASMAFNKWRYKGAPR